MCKEGFILYNNQFPSYCSTTNGCQDLCVNCLNSSFCIKCKSPSHLDEDGVCRMDCAAGFKFQLAIPYCKEICGDGINMGQYECDDGNTVDGDGCDHNCHKEGNAICTNGTTRGSCIFPSYEIQYLEGMYKVRATFNFEVANITSFVNIIKASITLDNGTKQQIPITSSASVNSSAIDLEFNLNEVETNGTELLSLDMINPLKHIRENATLNTTILVKTALPKTRIVKSTTTSAVAYTGVGAGVSGSVVGAVALKSAVSSVAIIELGQMISVLSLIKARDMPSYTKGMVEASSCTLLKFMPNFFSSPLASTKRQLSELNSEVFLNTIMPFILIMAATAIFYCIIKLLSRIKKCQKCTEKLLSLVEFSLFFRILQMSEFPIMLGVMTQLNRMSLGDVVGGVSTALALLFIIGIAIWQCTLVIFMYKNRIFLNSEVFIRKYGSLYSQYKLTGKAIYTPAAQLCRKLLICIIIFFDSGTLQCIWLICLSAAMILWTVIVRPYKNRADIWGVIIPELLMSLGVLFYMFLQSPTMLVYHIASIDIVVFVMLGSAFAVQVGFMVYSIVIACKNRKNTLQNNMNGTMNMTIDDSFYSKSMRNTYTNSSSKQMLEQKTDDDMEFRKANKTPWANYRVKI